MKYFRKYYLVIVFLSPILLNSCEDGINIFSRSDDVQLGQQLVAEINGNPQEFPPFRGDPTILTYINQRIFSEILQSSQVEDKDIFPYELQIIDKPDELNAFALPGGYIFIYSGLLKYLDSEAALAGVLGHEIAHAERRHATQRMTAQYGVEVMLGLLLGQNPTQVAEIASNLFVGLAFLANSRSDENESDEYSFRYLKDTRYYPGGVKFFFEKMQADGLISSGSSSVATFLSTHPDPVARITSTNELLINAGIPVKDYTATGEGIFRTEYQLNISGKLR